MKYWNENVKSFWNWLFQTKSISICILWWSWVVSQEDVDRRSLTSSLWRTSQGLWEPTTSSWLWRHWGTQWPGWTSTPVTWGWESCVSRAPREPYSIWTRTARSPACKTPSWTSITEAGGPKSAARWSTPEKTCSVQIKV